MAGVLPSASSNCRRVTSRPSKRHCTPGVPALGAADPDVVRMGRRAEYRRCSGAVRSLKLPGALRISAGGCRGPFASGDPLRLAEQSEVDCGGWHV